MFPDTWHTSTFEHNEGKILQEYVQQAYLEVGKKFKVKLKLKLKTWTKNFPLQKN